MDIKIGIIGGTIDRVWDNQWKLAGIDGAEIVAFSDVHDEYLTKAQDVFGLEASHVYSDYKELLEKEDINTCFIFNEPTLHLDIVKDCAAKGIHCFVEKPFSNTLEEAEEMIKVCKENNVKLMANAVYGYDAHLLGLHKDIIAEKKIGDILFMRWKGGNPGPKGKCSPIFYESLIDPDNGGGVIMDYVPYGGLVYSYYLGGVPDTVYATCATMNEDYKTVEDYALVTLNYKDKGVLGTIECSWNEEVPGGQFFNVTGTKGTLFHSQESNGTEIYGGMDYYYKLKGEAPQKIDTPKFDADNQDSISHFIDCILNDKPMLGMVTPECARDAAAIVDAVRLSIETGKEVQLKK